jgi:hypothetical protein
MRADDAQRVDIARAYLTGVRQTGVEQLPPSRLLIEAAELRRQLGIVLGVLEHQDESRQLAEIRAVLGSFDWEFHDRQLALEAIDRIVSGGTS